MIALKRITKILIVLAALAIAVCLLTVTVFFSGQLTEPLGGKGVTME